MAKTPSTIGKYRVLEQIATGGMGAVYTAEHPTLDRKVIIKKLTFRGDASVRERFRREARIMMDFRNDYIASVYDHFREGAYYHIVLEYVDGPSAEQLIAEQRYVPEEIALRICRDCCTALEYAHRRGVVHRDIKPSNILVSRTGQVKLVDFGIASVYGDEESILTREGMTLGTPCYMAPEQFRNTRNVDYRADIYSLGVSLYEMLTGKRPFTGGMSMEAVQRIQRGRYPRPRKVNPSVSRFAARFVRRLMQRKPKRRPQTVRTLIRRIDRRLERLIPGTAGVHSERVSAFVAGRWTPPPARSFVRRSARVLAFATVLAVAVGGGAAWYFGLHHELLSAREYGAMQLSVRIPREAYEDAEVPLAGAVYRNGTRVAEVPTADRPFRNDDERSTRRHVVMTARRLYLPAGDYRVKVRIGDQIHWNDIRIESRSVQRRREATRFARTLVVLARPFEPRELELEIVARDRRDGGRIDEPEIEHYSRGRWTSIDEVDELTSGRIHRFRVRAEGYRTREIEIDVPTYERTLFIDAALVPEEA